MKPSEIPTDQALAALRYQLRLSKARNKRRAARYLKLEKLSTRALGIQHLELQAARSFAEVAGFFKALKKFEQMDEDALAHLLGKGGVIDKTAGRNNLGRKYGKQGGT